MVRLHKRSKKICTCSFNITKFSIRCMFCFQAFCFFDYCYIFFCVFCFCFIEPNTRFPQLKIRDYVDINPLERHPGWRPGQIRRMDKYSGQSQIVYKEEGQEFLYWAHLNNPEEIAPFMTKSAETIAKQQQAHQQQVQQQQQQQQQQDPPPYNNSNMQNVNSNNSNNNKPNMRLNNNYSNSNNQNNPNYQNGYDNQNNGTHNHKESMMSFSQSTSSKVRRPLPPTLQGRSLPPKPPRKGKVAY